MKEYELSEVFHHTEDTMANEVLKMEHISYVYEEGEGNTFVLKKNNSSTVIGNSNLIGPVYQTPEPPPTPTTQPPAIVVETEFNSIVANNHEMTKDVVVLTTKKPHIVVSHNKGKTAVDEAVVKNIVNIYSSAKKHASTNTKASAAIIDTNKVALVNPQKSSKAGHKSGKAKKEKDVRKIRKMLHLIMYEKD